MKRRTPTNGTGSVAVSPSTATGGLFGQLFRYALTGGFATVVNIAVYWWLRDGMAWAPNAAWFIGYLGAVVTGYTMHSKWSFRGYGQKRTMLRTGSKFFLTSLVSLGFNSFWVWLLVVAAGLPTWAPIPLTIIITPLLVFAINRQWVFK